MLFLPYSPYKPHRYISIKLERNLFRNYTYPGHLIRLWQNFTVGFCCQIPINQDYYYYVYWEYIAVMIHIVRVK